MFPVVSREYGCVDAVLLILAVDWGGLIYFGTRTDKCRKVSSDEHTLKAVAACA